MRKFILGVFAAAFVVSLSACNTIEGAGRDISKAGDKIEDAAKKNK
jgi:predicted small secreted protein